MARKKLERIFTEQEIKKREKLLKRAEQLKEQLKKEQRALFDTARKLSLLRWGYMHYFQEMKEINRRTEPPIYILVEPPEGSDLAETFKEPFHMEIIKAHQLQEKGLLEILPDEEQDQPITKLSQIPDDRLHILESVGSMPDVLENLRTLNFSMLYEYNGHDPDYLKDCKINLHILSPRGTFEKIEKELERILEEK